MLSFLLLFTLVPVQEQERVPLNPPADAPRVKEQDGPVTLAIYDIRDLVSEMEMIQAEGEQRADAALMQFSKERRAKHAEKFRQSALEHMNPPFDPERNQLKTEDSDVLVFAGTGAQQAWLNAFLRAHRGMEQFLQIETRFIDGPRGAFREPKRSSGNRMFATDKDVQRYTASLQNQKDIHYLIAPTVVTTPGRDCSIHTVNEISYVKSWHLRIVEPGGQEIADPEVAVIHEGILLEMRIIPVPERAQQDKEGNWHCPKGLTYILMVDIENCRVERPIETKSVRLNSSSSDREVEISLPQVTRVSLEAQLSLSKGSGILIGGPSTEEDRDVAILIHLPEVEVQNPDKEKRRRR